MINERSDGRAAKEAETLTLDEAFVAIVGWWSSHKKRFLITFVILVCVSLGIIFLIPRQYSSTVTLFPSQSEPSMMSALAANPLLGSVLGVEGNLTANDIIVSILKSDSLRGRLLADKKIVEYIAAEDGLKEFDLQSATWQRVYLPLAKNKLQSMVAINKKINGPISISALTPDPEFSAYLVNLYLNTLEDMLKESVFTKAERKREFAQSLLNKRQKELEQLQRRLANFDSAGSMAAVPSSMLVLLEQISELVRKQAGLELFKEFLIEYDSGEAPQIQKIDQELSTIQRRIESLAKRANEGSSATLSVEIRPTGKIPLLALEFRLLQGRAKALEEVIVLLTKELELARIEASRDEINIQVLDRGLVDDIHDYPNRRTLTLVGFLMSLALAAFVTHATPRRRV